MSELLVQHKEIVVPGQILAKGMDFFPSFGTYRRNEDIVANRLGLVNLDGKVIKTIPLSGTYLPKRGDTIIARVTDILMSGWRAAIYNSPYESMLMVKEASNDFIAKGADLRQYFDINEFFVAKITNVTSQKLVDLTVRGPGLRKLRGGTLISVNAHKVPRIIGKKGSMVSMIKDATGCRITVGQNGLIWILGEPKQEVIAIKAIKKIEQESFTSGLTDTMKQYLEEATGTKVEMKAKEDEVQQ